MIKTKTFVSSDGRRELHAIITVTDPLLTFEEQTAGIMRDYALLLQENEGFTPIFRRWFLSDAANQARLLPDDGACATSVVEQSPLSLTKAALWVWMAEGAETHRVADGLFSVSLCGHTHLFECCRCRQGKDSYEATRAMLSATEGMLREAGGSLLESCVRTWFFVQNVDVNYRGVVVGRNDAFADYGLTPSTRFIASTGIGGRHADKTATVMMDSYSVIGLREGQMTQISAPDYLSPTSEYGVAFERAARVDYADRSHLFVSGTASINSRGEVVWEGEIRRQTLRMWENVGALLKAGGCGWDDVCQILVYLRDTADYPVVASMFEERFPDVPYVILYAPVCRSGWLVEMECIAAFK